VGSAHIWFAIVSCVVAGGAIGGCARKNAADAERSASGDGAKSAAENGAGANGAGAPADTSIWFEDVAHERGIDFRHVSGHRERPYFPEIMGGGAALFDMDGDADLDLYLVQSGSLYEPGSDAGRNRLFRNRGDGTFEDATQGSGADDRGYGMGCAVGDYDDDGDPDLYVTNLGADVLLRNDGGGKFTDVSKDAGVVESSWGSSATFADLDADGDLEIFVANFVHWKMENELECPNMLGQLDYCLPNSYESPSRSTLFRNDGGRFVDVSDAAGLGAELGHGLGVVTTDFDGDGKLDVFVANDSIFNHLWMNRGGLRFENEALMRGCAVDENGAAKAGMGVMAVDFDGDVDRDIVVVNLSKQSDSYYQNEGDFFSDGTARIGLAEASRAATRFGMGILDFDNDGYLDLYLACGRVVASLEAETADPYAESNILMRGKEGGVLEEVLPHGGTRERKILTARAAAFGDVDGDGGIDIVVVNRDAEARLLHNTRADRGNWVMFRVTERSGRDALGAVVTLTVGGRTIVRDVVSGYSYCAANDPRVHVGLGAASRAEGVTVTWVDGARESFGAFDANQVVELRRGAGTKAGT
jgi:hypothetical protein